MAALTSSKYDYDVAWDAGHGSNTAGKRTPDGYREHWINVRVAYYGMLYLMSRGLAVYKVGWDDTNAKDDADVSLSQRQKLVKKADCRILVSSHANAYGSGWNSAKGAETLIHKTSSKRGDSKKLADAIQKELVKGTKQTNRGVKKQNLAMCNCSAMGVVAAALVEIGFMTNEHEAELMKTDEFCKEQGEDIARGVLAYLGVEDKAVTEEKKTTKKKYSGTFPTLPKRGYYKVGDGYKTLKTSTTQIKRLQKFLNWEVNADLTVDGDYGEMTEEAVILFQKKYGLTTDGLFGSKSLAKAKTIKK